MLLEICANGFESAKIAQETGADRIELCVDLSVGGITPSYGVVEKVTSELEIPVHVLIRPRSGNFVYAPEEIDVMLRDIAMCKMIGCAGVVSGALTETGAIDVLNTSKLIHAAQGMEFTFHRAFDMSENPLQAFEKLQKLSITRLLTSGQEVKAIDGIELLKKLKALAKNQIQVMPGGGINPSNVMAFKEAGFGAVHTSASKKIDTQSYATLSKVSFKSDLTVSDEAVIREMKVLLEDPQGF